MSKASKLGTGTSFQQNGPISSRRQAINDATKAPTAGTLPPVELPVDSISLNPSNPRSQLGDLTHLAGSLRDHGQKTAISIMSRYSYVEANPGQESHLEPGTKYVAIDGNSRLAAAREAGLVTVKVMLDEALGSNPDEILESALVANIHRQDLDHLDEARALEQLLTVHKTQEALASRLHRSQGWVSQRLALLKLTPGLQKKLVSGEEPAELLRSVGRKKPEEQEQHLERLKEKKRRESGERKSRATRPEPAAVPEDQPASSQVTAPPEPQAAEPLHYGVMNQPAESEPAPSAHIAATVPDPRTDTVDKPRQVKMPWGDGAASMDIIFSKVLQSERRKMIGRYLDLLGDPEAFVADLEAATSVDYRRQVAELLQKSQ
ncbi:ParB/RepB/Spo0J family partition protein [Streptomyces sp. NPDC020141]|uniref:ParB/RepB/Spo0J family partition protein n=1 Tax=Streptomyces sp. NPDC020141 TaxID=3365065 RepID=UPI0037A8C940